MSSQLSSSTAATTAPFTETAPAAGGGGGPDKAAGMKKPAATEDRELTVAEKSAMLKDADAAREKANAAAEAESKAKREKASTAHRTAVEENNANCRKAIAEINKHREAALTSIKGLETFISFLDSERRRFDGQIVSVPETGAAAPKA